ncbi:MAG: Uma2 family endonuclease [Acidobacteriota bacterium]|nr:Uma2 family endonuclease [Acidobacteriota bacterium]
MATQTIIPLDFETEREKYLEFIDGHYQERFLGTGTHSDCQFNVTSLLKALAKQRGAVARQEWTIAHGDNWLVPDVTLSFNYTEDARGYLTSTPHLVVEILSPGQTEGELFRKCLRYHSWGIPHSWVIDPQTKICFEHHGGSDFTLIEANGHLTAGDVRIAAADIFAE